MSEEVDANDVITALTHQRNGALDENAKLYAMIEKLKRKVQELEAKLKP